MAPAETGLLTSTTEPHATITSHASGDAVVADSTLLLRGIASHPDLAADQLRARWYLSETLVCDDVVPADDGTTRCETRMLDESVQVSLEVRDSNNVSAAAIITLVPGQNAAPEVVLVTPRDGDSFSSGEMLTFAGTVSDTEDAPGDLRTWWESSVDGDLGLTGGADDDGAVSGRRTLSVGEHTLWLWVEATQGGVANDSSLVEVVEVTADSGGGHDTDSPEQPDTAATLSCVHASCRDILEAGHGSPDGIYCIDPEGDGIDSYEVYCDMTLDGGGWTLVAVSSDDGQVTWTWNERHLWDNDTRVFGSVEARHLDFKSPALHELTFTDLLFVHAPSSIWAAYGDVSDGTTDFGTVVGDLGAVCYASTRGYRLTAGTLTEQGDICDTDLYLNPRDQESLEDSCTTPGTEEDTWGPAWSVDNNSVCPMDDPGSISCLGPNANAGREDLEYANGDAVGYGHALGLNSGADGAAVNYMQVYLR